VTGTLMVAQNDGSDVIDRVRRNIVIQSVERESAWSGRRQYICPSRGQISPDRLQHQKHPKALNIDVFDYPIISNEPPRISEWTLYCQRHVFWNRVHNGPSRSSKVTDFGTNRKGVCIFLLVINSNFGAISEILQVFYWEEWPHPYSTRTLRRSP